MYPTIHCIAVPRTSQSMISYKMGTEYFLEFRSEVALWEFFTGNVVYMPSPKERFSLEFNFCYFSNAEFAKLNLRLILYFHKLCNDGLYK